jgi:hypothetical protein
MTPSTESQILQELQHIRAKQDLMHQKLFGDVDDETEHGRINRIERKQGLDHERISKLETLGIKAVTGFAVVVGLLEAGLHWLGKKLG